MQTFGIQIVDLILEFATKTTDNLTEGSTNKYYANSLVSNYLQANVEPNIQSNGNISANVMHMNVLSYRDGDINGGETLIYTSDTGTLATRQHEIVPQTMPNTSPVVSGDGAYLGRPGRPFSRTSTWRLGVDQIHPQTVGTDDPTIDKDRIKIAGIDSGATSVTNFSNVEQHYVPVDLEFAGFQETGTSFGLVVIHI